MNFDQLTVLPSLLAGGGIASFIWLLLDKGNSGKTATQAFVGDSSEEVARLQAELAGVKEEADKVADLHSYTRQLEAKVQVLEAASAEPGSEEHEMRVKVLEQQLSEKAALEAKLAATQQELSDLKAKFEMHQAMSVPTPVASPVAELKPEPASAPAAVEAPQVVETPKLEEVVSPFAEPVKVEEPSAPVEMEVVHNDNPVPPTAQPMVASGGVATAAQLEPIEDRPALRVEVPTPVAVGDNRDPLEDIDGIGPVYQQKLYEAGIKTFAQLAAASPSRITEVIEPQNWQHIDVMKWRREAALYAAGEKS
ncbi:MAG: helix-hairpin-helix domain-containing protein [Armatimonadota bacterium]